MERLDLDLLFRWFVGLGIDGPVWNASTFSKNLNLLLADGILLYSRFKILRFRAGSSG